MAKPSRVAVIINPMSGSEGGVETGRSRSARAMAVLESCGCQPQIFVSEWPGHAHDLARRALDERVDLAFVWGGDGTVNEVASVFAFSGTPMAIVPAGSGNGLAASLGIPRRPEAAMPQALEGCDRAIDAGRLDDRMFFNVAGVGFDAHIAHRFDEANGRRGALSYVSLALRELVTFQPPTCRITVDGERREYRVDLVAIANGAEYGNGARIAPEARLDDGALDLVIAESRRPAINMWRAIRLMTGSFAGAPGVSTRRVRELSIEADVPIRFHVDGEPALGGTRLDVRVHPGALLVRGSMVNDRR